MKRIRVILEHIDGQEMLKITDPLFVAILADRFIIDDRRKETKAKASAVTATDRNA